MDAIRLTSENLQAVLQRGKLTEKEAAAIERYYLIKEYYFISGYYNSRSVLLGWSIVPGHILRKYFEFDEIKIQTDWDQIVRKEKYNGAV